MCQVPGLVAVASLGLAWPTTIAATRRFRGRYLRDFQPLQEGRDLFGDISDQALHLARIVYEGSLAFGPTLELLPYKPTRCQYIRTATIHHKRRTAHCSRALRSAVP